MGHTELEPGQTCDACGRRKPFPKKETSPTSKPRSYRVPADEVVAHEETLTDVAKFLGTHERPYWQFATLTIALALVLQDESLRGFAQRTPA